MAGLEGEKEGEKPSQSLLTWPFPVIFLQNWWGQQVSWGPIKGLRRSGKVSIEGEQMGEEFRCPSDRVALEGEPCQ